MRQIFVDILLTGAIVLMALKIATLVEEVDDLKNLFIRRTAIKPEAEVLEKARRN